MLKKIIGFWITILISNVSFSQCEIKGKVVDDQKIPLEFVTVELYKDSIFQVGGITEKNGGFELKEIECDESYILKIRYVGYMTIEDTIVSSNQRSKLSFELKTDSETFDEVLVTTKKPTIERQADRLVYYVNESFVTGNNSAYEVLKTTPSVWIDGNGNIRINGRQGAQVMINGKLLKMGGIQLQNYLSGLDGKEVLKIEVIAMPGSEFDASSKGGIVNIEMRKRFLDGYNARLFAGYEQGKYPEYSTGVFSNYKKGKLTTTANFYVFQRNNFTDNNEKRTSLDNSFNLNSSFFSKLKVNNNQVRLGADYDINDNQNINVEYVRTYNQNNHDVDAVSNLSNNSGKTEIQGLYDTKSITIYNGTSLNYKWQTDTLGSTFKILGDYVYNENKTNGLFSSDYFEEDSGILLSNSATANQLDQLSKIYSANIDYQHNFKNRSSLQGGAKYGHSGIDNDAIEREKVNGEFIVNPFRTTIFTYTESIYAGYLNYSGALKNLKYKIGLRMEDSYIDGVSKDQTTNFDVHYFDLFPSAFLLWEFGKESSNAISLAANRKINRPSFEALNPFEYVLNEFSINRGNTSLRPEYTKNIELNYTYLNNYSLGLIYSKTEDIISDVLIANEDVAIYETQNISNQNSYGANISLSFSPIKKVVQTYMAFALTNNEYSSNIVDESLATFFVRVNNSFSLIKGIKANLAFSYSTKELAGNRIYDPYGQMDASMSKSFLNDKLTISLGVQDIFDFQNNNAVLVDSSEEIIIKEKYQSRKIQLYVFYNFGIGKSFKKKRIESADTGEKSRLKN